MVSCLTERGPGTKGGVGRTLCAPPLHSPFAQRRGGTNPRAEGGRLSLHVAYRGTERGDAGKERAARVRGQR